MKNGILSIVLGLAGKAYKAIRSLFSGASAFARPLFSRLVSLVVSKLSPSKARERSERRSNLETLRKRAEEALAEQEKRATGEGCEDVIIAEAEECPDMVEAETVESDVVEAEVAETEVAESEIVETETIGPADSNHKDENAANTAKTQPSGKPMKAAPVAGASHGNPNKGQSAGDNGMSVLLPRLGRALARAMSLPSPVRRNIPSVIAASSS